MSSEEPQFLCSCSICGPVPVPVPERTYHEHRRHRKADISTDLDAFLARLAPNQGGPSTSSHVDPEATEPTQVTGSSESSHSQREMVRGGLDTDHDVEIGWPYETDLARSEHGRDSHLDIMEHSVDRGSTGGGKRTHDEMEASTTTSVRIEAAPGRSLFEDENVNTMRSFEVEQDEDTLDAEDNEIEEVDPGSIDAPVDDQEDVPPEHEEDEAARRVEIEETLGEDNVEEPVEEGAHREEDARPEQGPRFSRIPDLRNAQEFIHALQNATLNDGSLSPDSLYRLRNPPEFPLDVSDPDLRLSLDLFLSVSNASEATYNQARAAFLRRHPGDNLFSYSQVKAKIAELSGIIPIVSDMCPNTCMAYTGPFSELETCPFCSERRYDTKPHRGGVRKVPRRQFSTIPLGPQLQACWRSVEGARSMKYRTRVTSEIIEQVGQNNGQIPVFSDIYSGTDYLEAVAEGIICPDDMVLLLSIDGAQLYKMKQSDCWIYIWVVMDRRPEIRYKKKYVLPGNIIPGPNKPKHIDSFLFPGLSHVAALQREGLRVWDAHENRTFISKLFVALATADTPGMAYLNGLVGHNGGYGCRLYCPIKGRHKHGQPYYYPAFLIPDNYTVPGCDHPDYDAAHIPVATQGVNDYATNLQYVLDSTGETNYKRRRLATGISKPSIFSGLPRTLGVPGCFPADLMHLVSLNLTDLFLGLWRGTIDCDATDNRNDWDFAVLRNADTWKQHGAVIANALPYLPTSFDRPPRNPAEKISSGYKAWEFLTYIFGLAPATLYGILPDQYWVNFCRLVGAVRLLHQRSITRDEILRSHARVVQFIKEYELLYYQRRADRLHFCRPSIHALIHMAFETIRLGPLCYFTQWTLERTIGNLVEELKQHSRPYANLSQRYLRRGEVNALKAMVPELDPDGISLPPGAQSFEDGYVFLPARDKSPRLMGPLESQALWRYLGLERGDNARVARWSRLRLPNGQIARAAWKEKAKSLNKVRMCRNVKLHLNNRTEFAEVQFYFSVIVNSVEHPLALVSLFSPPDPNMLEKSLGAVWSCRYQGAAGLRVVPIKCITSVVAVVPFPLGAHTQVRAIAERPHFIVEKMGLDVAYMGGHEEIEAIADEVE